MRKVIETGREYCLSTMCKQTVGDDDFISNKCNSNQPNYQINTLIKDDSLSSNLHAVPLLPKNPTISTKNYLSENNNNIIATLITKNTTKSKVKSHYSILPISSIHEARLIANIVLPMILTSLLIYSKSMISTIFLGRLGDHALAAGSLALGFANITGYSLLSGLAMGMDPICGQAYGAKNHALLGLTLHKTVLLLLTTSIPVSILWLNMERILILFHQDRSIAALAQSFLIYSLPDLLAQSILHPLKIYLRTQSITKPLTLAAVFSTMAHLPLTWLAVVKLKLGIQGIAIAGVITNYNMVIFLVTYVMLSEPCKKGWAPVSMESFKGFSKLLKLSIPSCISVCLEWWWYEIMILLTGLLPDPNSTIGSMGVLIQTTSLIYIFPSSLSVGVSTRVGNELGSGRPDRAKRAANTGMFFSFLLGIFAVLFTFTVREKWAQLFTDDVEIIKLTVMVLPVIGLCELGNCPQTTGCGVLRGTARPKVGANINLGCFYLVGMPVAVWLGFGLGLGFRGLWFGLLAAQGSCVVTMLVVLYRTNWKVEAKRAEQLTDHYNCEVKNNVHKLDGQLLV